MHQPRPDGLAPASLLGCRKSPRRIAMSEVRLIVRDARRQINGTCHGATADRVVAALSTEPETIEEVETGMARFAAPEARPVFRCFGGSIDEEPYDAGLVVIDLAA